MRVCIFILVFFITSLASYASDNSTSDNSSIFINDFSLTVGVLSFIVPRYEGSDIIRFVTVPNISISYKKFIFLNPFGIGVNVPLNKNFIVGGTIGKDFFGISGDRTINGLNNNEKGVILTPYIRFMLDRKFYTSLSFYKAISGSDSLSIDLRIGYNFVITKKLTTGVSAKGSWADKKYMMLKFGITPEQSMVSGFQVYSPTSDLKSAEFIIDVKYAITKKLTLAASYSEGYLLNQAAKSPTTFIKRMPRALLGLNYTFN